MVTVDMKTGAPMGGTPEGAQMMYTMGALALKYRLPVAHCGYSKFATDCEQLVGWYKYAGGLPFDDFKEAMAAIREVGPQGHFLGTQHTLEHFESAFFMPTIMDFNSFEQWKAEGAKDHDTRGREKARNMLADYEEPKLEEGIAEGLTDFIARREEALPNSVS